MDIALNAAGTDIVFPLRQYDTWIEDLQHRIRHRILLHEGEWPQDTRRGQPWGTWLAMGRFPIENCRSTLNREIQLLDDVIFASIQVTQNPTTFAIEITGSVEARDPSTGEITTVEVTNRTMQQPEAGSLVGIVFFT